MCGLLTAEVAGDSSTARRPFLADRSLGQLFGVGAEKLLMEQCDI